MNLMAVFSTPVAAATAPSHANFRTAIYARAQEVKEMGDREALRTRFSAMHAHSPDAGKTVIKVPLKPHSFRALLKEP
jgi:hypothetical protein